MRSGVFLFWLLSACWRCSQGSSKALRDSPPWFRPPRFELAAKPGKTLRSVIEVSNRSTAPANYLIHTADWSLSPDFSVNFHDDLQHGSCRPWVAHRAARSGGARRGNFALSLRGDGAGGCAGGRMPFRRDDRRRRTFDRPQQGPGRAGYRPHRRHRLRDHRRGRAGARDARARRSPT